MAHFEVTQQRLLAQPKRWLITGCAGFIGSNLLEALLKLDQVVVGIDNFSTGSYQNLDEVKSEVTEEQWERFTFIHGDIRSLDDCRRAVEGIDHVLHQAALGSVPRSIDDPVTSNEVNVSGFLNIMVASRDAKVSSFVYAASSSTYGDHPGLPKVEDVIGRPLSPYAVTKFVNELYADVFERSYGFATIGLRYFNVFGKRQAPGGAYAAVIPKWIQAMISGSRVSINGAGDTSRDFCYIQNVVMANLLAATANESAKNAVYNIALGDSTTLNELFGLLRDGLATHGIKYSIAPEYRDYRKGDVRHSRADVNKAATKLGYAPAFPIKRGVELTVPWYVRKYGGATQQATD